MGDVIDIAIIDILGAEKIPEVSFDDDDDFGQGNN
jgi:hypothetical protein